MASLDKKYKKILKAIKKSFFFCSYTDIRLTSVEVVRDDLDKHKFILRVGFRESL